MRLALLALLMLGCAASPPPTEHDIEPVECSGEARYHGEC